MTKIFQVEAIVLSLCSLVLIAIGEVHIAILSFLLAFILFLALRSKSKRATNQERQNRASDHLRDLPGGYRIAGINFHLKTLDCCGVKSGTVKTEYDNPYDKNAVGIYIEGKLIGYIEQDENESVRNALIPMGGSSEWKGYIRTFQNDENETRLFGRIWIDGIDPEFRKIDMP